MCSLCPGANRCPAGKQEGGSVFSPPAFPFMPKYRYMHEESYIYSIIINTRRSVTTRIVAQKPVGIVSSELRTRNLFVLRVSLGRLVL